MHHRVRACARCIALVLPVALLLPVPARAGDRRPDDGERRVLLHDDETVLARRSSLSYFELAESHGVAYRRDLVLGGHPVTFKVHGPVQEKAFGIGFKIKF